LAFKVKPFQLVHPKWFLKNKYFLFLDVYGASIYIVHHLEMMTNFWKGETFSCPHSIKAF
jgi:hypothetical protein